MQPFLLHRRKDECICFECKAAMIAWVSGRANCNLWYCICQPTRWESFSVSKIALDPCTGWIFQLWLQNCVPKRVLILGLFRSMCRTKPKMVEQPIPVKPPRKPKYSDDMLTTSKSTDLSLNSSQFSKESRLSTSSAASLASVRDLLPENPNIYTFREITRATNHFRTGKLGNSSVWRCTLRGKSVVVTERSKTEFLDFRTKLREICNVHHTSIVKLLGGNSESEHLYLVYEYSEGANLNECLRGSKVPGYTVLSSWISRMQIAIDVAQGLEYIHHDTAVKYVHKFIKSSSIIVVEPGFRAKIAHFGTSELSGELSVKHDTVSSSAEITEEESGEASDRYKRSHSTKITGTQGYMAPEYVANGIVSQKTDVFAFGVILLELLSGQEPVKFHFDAATNQYKRVSLIETVYSIVSETECLGKLRAWIDPRLKDSYPVDSAEKVARLATSCLDMDPSSRPDMRYVVGELSKVYLKSKNWSEKMNANKAFISGTFEGRLQGAAPCFLANSWIWMQSLIWMLPIVVSCKAMQRNIPWEQKKSDNVQVGLKNL
eukprot:Gb_15924 [translate_table: standard]